MGGPSSCPRGGPILAQGHSFHLPRPLPAGRAATSSLAGGIWGCPASNPHHRAADGPTGSGPTKGLPKGCREDVSHMAPSCALLGGWSPQAHGLGGRRARAPPCGVSGLRPPEQHGLQVTRQEDRPLPAGSPPLRSEPPLKFGSGCQPSCWREDAARPIPRLPTGSPGTPTGPSRPWSPWGPASPWGGMSR